MNNDEKLEQGGAGFQEENTRQGSEVHGSRVQGLGFNSSRYNGSYLVGMDLRAVRRPCAALNSGRAAAVAKAMAGHGRCVPTKSAEAEHRWFCATSRRLLKNFYWRGVSNWLCLKFLHVKNNLHNYSYYVNYERHTSCLAFRAHCDGTLIAI